MNSIKLNSGLVREGVSIQEMFKLLQLYSELRDYTEVRKIVFRENYLGKISDSRIEDILRAFKKRFLSNFGLPSAEVVGEIIKSDLSDAGKKQILLPYYLYSDDLLRLAYLELVVASFKLERSLTLDHTDVLDFLREIGKRHNNVRKWSKYLKGKWATRFLTFLRTFGLLEKFPDNRLKKIHVKPGTFAFFTLWLTSNGRPFQNVLSHDIWGMYLLDRSEVMELAHTASRKGWWLIEISGDIISFQPNYSLEEWLKYGME
ncbi:MAG: protein containing Protein of unknown function DUF1819, putative inner membrane [Candidatus Syntrophoarchaeum butanivorans]|uniref:DUF1819 family protein n=1 Tax=Candidatus Syntropharchaeum butanivorans TaxID=1839936 RepID=A0A1F2P8F5_9EURY|nr:MAG: protein containing Protein of unknown function DUF1819, putative inner membrane [Candidatus Syntrophoarchaeum butanivorans]